MELYDTEEEQVQAIKEWWKENGKAVIIGAVLGLGGTQVGRVIRTEEDANELQGDLDRLYDWARKWQMEFNIGKCSVMSARLEKKKCMVDK